MIKEEFVSYETAKLLKAAGFPQDIKQTGFYNKHGQDYHFGDGAYNDGCAKPTQAVAMRWLREEHSISVEPAVTIDEQWSLNVCEFKSVDIIADDEVDRFPTYEAAAEAGIQAACKYIISKGKERKGKERKGIRHESMDSPRL